MYTPADLEKAGSFVVFGHSTTGAMAASPIEQLLQKVESMNGFATWATPQISAIYETAAFPRPNITQRFEGNVDLEQLTEHYKTINVRVKVASILAERTALRNRVKVAVYFICRSVLKEPAPDYGESLKLAGIKRACAAGGGSFVAKRPSMIPAAARVAAKSSTRTLTGGYSTDIVLDQIEARDDFVLWKSGLSIEELATLATKFPDPTRMRMCVDPYKKSIQKVNLSLIHI